MTWTIDGPQGFESDKIAHLIVPYTRGTGVDVGCGQRTAWPHFIGIDSGKQWGRKVSAIQAQGETLPMIAYHSLDFVFSSHFLEHVEDYKATLADWWCRIKPGGHLVLYLPHADLYPRKGTEGANPDHKSDFLPADIITAMEGIANDGSDGWTLIEDETRDQGNEYSFFQVYRKRMHSDGTNVHLWQRNPQGKKRCLLIRYGAIGDQIIAASVLPGLKKQGWYITYNTTPQGADILSEDPHVDEFLLQDKDQVPNAQLGPYWEAMAERYDKVINLCESVEGALLALPGRLQHGYSEDSRRRLFNVNYLERTHDIAGVPHDFRPRFYPSDDERKWARAQLRRGGPNILAAINGSSVHKIWPYFDTLIKWLVERNDANIFLTGDKATGAELQDAILDCVTRDGVKTEGVIRCAGDWPIRNALAFAQQCDLVIGPETGVLNSVCRDQVPKVVMLSHSSHENLTKHWINTSVLSPEAGTTPCYPCHRMHFGWDHCTQAPETQAALCASRISPEVAYKAIERWLKQRKAA